MGTWRVIIGEPLVGFVVHAAPWTKMAKVYTAFKERVRLMANLAGVPADIPADTAATLCIAIAWRKRARIDTSNILKAVEDGLFKQDRGVEKIVCDRFEHMGTEEASIIISFGERKRENHQKPKGHLARGMP